MKSFFFFDINIFQPFTRVVHLTPIKKDYYTEKKKILISFASRFYIIVRMASYIDMHMCFQGAGGGGREHYMIYFKRKRKSTRQPYLYFFGCHVFSTFKNLNKTANKTHTSSLSLCLSLIYHDEFME